jgi:hypothetical protein
VRWESIEFQFAGASTSEAVLDLARGMNQLFEMGSMVASRPLLAV